MFQVLHSTNLHILARFVVINSCVFKLIALNFLNNNVIIAKYKFMSFIFQEFNSAFYKNSFNKFNLYLSFQTA